VPTTLDRSDGGGTRPDAAGPWSVHEGWRGALGSVVVVTLLAMVDLSAGQDVVVAGLLTVGPCLAAITGSPRTVVAVGVYSVLLILALSWADGIWWTRHQLIYVLALVAVTAISAFAAHRRRAGERRVILAEADAARSHATSEATVEFLSRVSHELRTPLNAMLGFTQLLQRDDLTPDQRETTEQIARGGQHLLALVNDVLDVTAAEAGRMSLSLEPVSVGAVARAALELTEADARARGVNLHALLGQADDWYVMADARRLRQIALNLLSNAVKFDRPGGDVTISATRHDAGTISLAVTDTGPGIAAKDLGRIFTPFERLDATQGVEGTGLGLAVSRGLAEAMGGTLTVASREGLGATFTVTFEECGAPVETLARVPSMRREVPSAPHTVRPTSVLYVEDNLSNLRLVERILELRPGWRMTHASDGVTGLDLALSTPFDLVLLDQNLPDMHGLEVLRQLRSRENRLDVPVVILSADAAPGKVTRALNAGATDYLVKPFSVEGLLAVLDEHAPH
jgi:signal transduction histidine kinase/ActR/RegA family two-component response regulator